MLSSCSFPDVTWASFVFSSLPPWPGGGLEVRQIWSYHFHHRCSLNHHWSLWSVDLKGPLPEEGLDQETQGELKQQRGTPLPTREEYAPSIHCTYYVMRDWTLGAVLIQTVWQTCSENIWCEPYSHLNCQTESLTSCFFHSHLLYYQLFMSNCKDHFFSECSLWPSKIRFLNVYLWL